jgi:chromosome segregation ATPase
MSSKTGVIVQAGINLRYDKFMGAFDHIKDQIDRIYKELTRSENFKQGGSAYLALEDNDVSHPVLVLTLGTLPRWGKI